MKELSGTELTGFTASFSNMYKANGSTTITAQKLLDGSLADSTAGFSFSLVEGTVDGNTFTEKTGGVSVNVNVSTDENGTVNFGAISYTAAGTYWYKITENTTETLLKTYVCDDAVYYVKVEVTDDGKGHLTAEQTIYQDGLTDAFITTSITFTNYTRTSFKVTKAWVDDSESDRPEVIYVMLQRAVGQSPDDDDYESVDVNGDGVVNAGDLVSLTATTGWTYEWTGLESCEFDNPSNTYTFRVLEAKVTWNEAKDEIVSYELLDSGALVDTASRDSQYTVSYGTVDDSDGDDIQDMTISNTLGATLRITKSVVNPLTSAKTDASAFKINLMLSAASGKDYAETYSYTIYNEDGSTDSTGTFAWELAAGLSFNLKDGQYVEIENLPIGTTYTVSETLASGQSYTTTFIVGGTSQSDKISGTLSDSSASVTVTNTYTASGSLTLSAVKIEDYHGSANTESREYTFNLYAASVESGTWTKSGDVLSQATVSLTGRSESSGSNSFAAISYENEEGTYYYIVEEVIPASTCRTYDTARYLIEVTVTDSEAHDGTLAATVTNVWNVDGGANAASWSQSSETQLITGGTETTYASEFTNSYTATGTLILPVTKTVTYGGETYANVSESARFTFTLTSEDDTDNALKTATITGEQVKDDSGTYTLDEAFALNYNQDDIGKTYHYTVTETAADGGGYTVSARSYTLTVTVGDNGNNTLDLSEYSISLGSVAADSLSFTNAYTATGEATITLGKTLDGGYTTVPENTFSATLQSGTVSGDVFTSDGTAAETAAFAAGTTGTASFTLKYTMIGEYWYRVSEVIPAGAVDHDDGSYTYDTTLYYVLVTVTDDQDGTLSTAVEIHKGSPTGATVSAVNGKDITFANISTTSYEVVKSWVGDTAVSSVTRPESVTVQLKRKTSTDTEWTAVGNPVTLTENGEWTYKWSALPVYADSTGTKYVYQAFEVEDSTALAAGGTLSGAIQGSSYTVNYTETTVGETITNTLNTGSMTVTKMVKDLGVTSTENYKVAVTFTLGGSTLAGTCSYTIKDAGGITKESEENVTLTNGVLTVSLQENDVLTVTDLPLGTTYTVAENLTQTQAGYYDVSYTAQTGTVTATSAAAQVINTYKPTGSLTLTAKKTENYHGLSTDEGRVYTFNLYAASVNNGIWTKSSSTVLRQATVDLTGSSGSSGSDSFTAISYSKTGTYRYIVEEVIPTDTHRTYDTARYLIEVTVTDSDDHNGTLIATVTNVWKVDGGTTATSWSQSAGTRPVANGTATTYAAEFTNSYEADGTLTLPVTKTVTYGGATYADVSESANFTFTLASVEGAYYDADNASQEVTITGAQVKDGSGTYTTTTSESFKLEYDQDDVGETYQYTVTETAANGGGYTVSTQSYTLIVEVKDNGNNGLTLSKTMTLGSDTVTALSFTNAYTATGTATINLGKILDGGFTEVPGSTFSAALQSGTVSESVFTSDGTAAKTATFATGGTASFTLSYTMPGTYWYQVSEVIPDGAVNDDDGKYTYDTTEYYVLVTVTDNHNGTLSTAVEIHKGSPTGDIVPVVNDKDITFANITTTSYQVVKSWAGDTAVSSVTRPESVTVQLMRKTKDTEWTAVGDPVTLTESDTWTHRWSALPVYADSAGTAYVYQAFELEDSTALAAGETLNGKTEGSSYTVNYTETTGGETITNTLDTGTLTVTKRVEVLEVTSEEEYEVAVTFKLGGSTLTGSYSYTITDGNGAQRSLGSANLSLTDGVLTISLQENDVLKVTGLPLGTTYTVTENLTEAQEGYYKVSYENETGTVTETTSAAQVINTYKPSGSLTLTADLTENYHGSVNDEARSYTFYVYEATVASGAELTAISNWQISETPLNETTVTLDGETVTGQADFPEIIYTAVGTYYYMVEEMIPAATYRTYDTTQYWIQVEVTDTNDHDGTLVGQVTGVWTLDGGSLTLVEDESVSEMVYAGIFPFINSYEAAGDLTLTLTKQVTRDGALYGLDERGEDLVFIFDLMDSEGTVLDTVTVTGADLAGSGSAEVSFTALAYTENDIGAVYTYRVAEQAQTVTGYAMDERTYQVTVEVSDNGDNTLTAMAVIVEEDSTGSDGEDAAEEAELIFVNVYDPVVVQVDLPVGKILDGGYTSLEGTEFSAILQAGTVDDEGNFTADAADRETAVFDENGSATFRRTYAEEGTWWYEVTEAVPSEAVDGDDGSYTYDTSTYYVKVVVTDGRSGALVADISVYLDAPDGDRVETTGEAILTFANRSTMSWRVTKKWENSATAIPESVQVQLMRKTADSDWEAIGSPVTLTDSDSWTCLWNALPLCADDSGAAYTYRVAELNGDGDAVEEDSQMTAASGDSYLVSYEEEEAGTVILNTYVPPEETTEEITEETTEEATEPEESTAVETSGESEETADSIRTGDTSQMELWIVIALAALAACILLLLIRRRRDRGEE